MSDNLEETASALGEPAFTSPENVAAKSPNSPSCAKLFPSASASPSLGETAINTITFSAEVTSSGVFRSNLHGEVYELRTAYSSGRAYMASEIDFLVAYLAPEDIWHVFPITSLVGRRNIYIPIHTRKKPRWDEYREAWRLIHDCPQAQLCHPAVQLQPEVSEPRIAEEPPGTNGE